MSKQTLVLVLKTVFMPLTKKQTIGQKKPCAANTAEMPFNFNRSMTLIYLKLEKCLEVKDNMSGAIFVTTCLL